MISFSVIQIFLGDMAFFQTSTNLVLPDNLLGIGNIIQSVSVKGGHPMVNTYRMKYSQSKVLNSEHILNFLFEFVVCQSSFL